MVVIIAAAHDLNRPGYGIRRHRNALNRTGKRPSFTEEQRLQRDREGLAYIFKQFVRYGVTSLHHQGGNLAALQQVGRAESSCTA